MITLSNELPPDRCAYLPTGLRLVRLSPWRDEAGHYARHVEAVAILRRRGRYAEVRRRRSKATAMRGRPVCAVFAWPEAPASKHQEAR